MLQAHELLKKTDIITVHNCYNGCCTKDNHRLQKEVNQSSENAEIKTEKC